MILGRELSATRAKLFYNCSNYSPTLQLYDCVVIFETIKCDNIREGIILKNYLSTIS